MIDDKEFLASLGKKVDTILDDKRSQLDISIKQVKKTIADRIQEGAKEVEEGWNEKSGNHWKLKNPDGSTDEWRVDPHGGTHITHLDPTQDESTKQLSKQKPTGPHVKSRSELIKDSTIHPLRAVGKLVRLGNDIESLKRNPLALVKKIHELLPEIKKTHPEEVPRLMQLMSTATEGDPFAIASLADFYLQLEHSAENRVSEQKDSGEISEYQEFMKRFHAWEAMPGGIHKKRAGILLHRYIQKHSQELERGKRLAAA